MAAGLRQAQPERVTSFTRANWYEPLIFDWDDEAGTVAVPGADLIHRFIAHGGVQAGPHPCGDWPFSLDWLKSRTDMAAIIGYAREGSPELADD